MGRGHRALFGLLYGSLTGWPATLYLLTSQISPDIQAVELGDRLILVQDWAWEALRAWVPVLQPLRRVFVFERAEILHWHRRLLQDVGLPPVGLDQAVANVVYNERRRGVPPALVATQLGLSLSEFDTKFGSFVT